LIEEKAKPVSMSEKREEI
jgi:hypothetical protein